MRVGSWRDANVRWSASVAVACALVAFLAATWLLGVAPADGGGALMVLLPPVGLGFALAIVIRSRGGAKEPPGTILEVPHRGPNMSRISMAGFPGLVFVCGYVLMFWGGAPHFRPVVVAMAIVGSLGGVLLVCVRRNRRPPSSTPLDLRGSSDQVTAHSVLPSVRDSDGSETKLPGPSSTSCS